MNAEILASSSRIISQSKPLRDNLLVHAPIGSALDSTNKSIIANAIESKNKLLLVAPLKTRHMDRSGKFSKLPVVGNFGLDSIFVRSYVWDDTCKAQATAIELWEKGHNIIAIAVLVPQSNGSRIIGQVREIALLPVSNAWIPCYSEREFQQDELLRSRGTAFIKPLHFDAPPDAQLPDFFVAEGDGLKAIRAD